jgi:hypothetical protein
MKVQEAATSGGTIVYNVSRENNVAREPQTRGEGQLKVCIVCFLVRASAEHPCLAIIFPREVVCQQSPDPRAVRLRGSSCNQDLFDSPAELKGPISQALKLAMGAGNEDPHAWRRYGRTLSAGSCCEN